MTTKGFPVKLKSYKEDGEWCDLYLNAECFYTSPSLSVERMTSKGWEVSFMGEEHLEAVANGEEKAPEQVWIQEYKEVRGLGQCRVWEVLRVFPSPEMVSSPWLDIATRWR